MSYLPQLPPCRRKHIQVCVQGLMVKGYAAENLHRPEMGAHSTFDVPKEVLQSLHACEQYHSSQAAFADTSPRMALKQCRHVRRLSSCLALRHLSRACMLTSVCSSYRCTEEGRLPCTDGVKLPF